MRTEEKELQIACEKILKKLGYERGTDYIHKQNNVHQKFRKGTNCNMPNLADLIIFIDNGITLVIELKTPKGKRTEGQIAASQKLIRKGHLYFIVRSLSEFLEILAKYNIVK
jgi:hypothetical protein